MKKLIDEYLPLFHFSETHATEVKVPANVVYSSVLACDLGQSAIVRFLFRLRRLPECKMTFEGLQQIGFRLLARREDREIETRIQCTSFWSRTHFALYWSLIRPFSGLIRRGWLRLIKQHAENALTT